MAFPLSFISSFLRSFLGLQQPPVHQNTAATRRRPRGGGIPGSETQPGRTAAAAQKPRSYSTDAAAAPRATVEPRTDAGARVCLSRAARAARVHGPGQRANARECDLGGAQCSQAQQLSRGAARAPGSPVYATIGHRTLRACVCSQYRPGLVSSMRTGNLMRLQKSVPCRECPPADHEQ